MKICMVNVYYDPDMMGGVEWYIKDISSYLAALGHKPEIFASTRHRRPPEENYGEPNISVRHFPTLIAPSYRVRIWPQVIRAILSSDADIVHCFDYLQFQTLATMLAKRSQRVPRPSVVTVIDLQHLVPRPRLKALLVGLADRAFSRTVSRSFDLTLVRAPDLIDPLVSMGFDRERIRITQSGIRDEFLAPGDGESFRSKHGLEGNLVLYLGRINRTKGLSFLVKAAPAVLQENPDTTFVVVGRDEGNHRAELETMTRREKVQDRFRFLGPIHSLEEKRDALSACDVFVLPSGYEGTSQSVMQAMAQGAAVVSTRVGGMPFLIRDGFDGYLVPYGQIQPLSQRINAILGNPSQRRRIGRRARARASKQFRYSKLAKQLESIYEEAISQHHKG